MYVVNKAIFLWEREREKREGGKYERNSLSSLFGRLWGFLVGRRIMAEECVMSLTLGHLREGSKREEEGAGFTHKDEKTSHVGSVWKVSS